MKSIVVAITLFTALTFFALTLGHSVVMGKFLLHSGFEPAVLQITGLSVADFDSQDPGLLSSRMVLPIVNGDDIWRCSAEQASPLITQAGREVTSQRVSDRSCIEESREFRGGIVQGNLSVGSATLAGTVLVRGYTEVAEIVVVAGLSACLISFGDIWIDNITTEAGSSLTVISTGGKISAPPELPTTVALLSADTVYRGADWIPANCLAQTGWIAKQA